MLRFAIAQPARTAGSGIDHPIVARHPGLVARQTWFVEQGPIVSFHRSVLDAVLPFDLRSPMGWGIEGTWSALVEQRGLQMGIIDAVSMDHSVRPVLTNYSLGEASLVPTLSSPPSPTGPSTTACASWAIRALP